MELHTVSQQSQQIRQAYHQLEEQYHGREWTTAEDALAFSTDVALVNRMIMSHTGIWPEEDASKEQLAAKIGESVWWLATLAEQVDIDFEAAVTQFLEQKKQAFHLE
jgi:hypothetical protein